MERFNPIAIANFFVDKGVDQGRPITPMQLVKLVYITHGWYLALTGKPLIDEEVQAWKYGPVVNSVYHTFKWWGGSPITIPSDRVRAVESDALKGVSNMDEFLHSIWKRYSHLSGVQLSTITHEEGSPWHTVWERQGGKNRVGAVIPDPLIRGYYKNKLLNPQSNSRKNNV